jgi:predicted N-acetyltransferase YhbS
MPADVEMIRQFREEDAEACSNLIRACLSLDLQIRDETREELMRLESPAIMCERAKLFYLAVCMEERSIAGGGGVDMNEIRLLFVDPERRRRGIGGLLLRHLEALIPPALFGDAFVYSAPGAMGFYRAHGYQPGGEYDFKVSGHTVPTVFMAKRLAK